MKISEINFRHENDPGENKRLLAFCSITLDDCFAVRDMKIIECGTGEMFVAMPDRKVSANCYHCNCKNRINANFCNQCGAELPVEEIQDAFPKDHKGRPQLFLDVAHPINNDYRAYLQKTVLDAYRDSLSDNNGYCDTR